jgi:small-conductance mechanosensitive channel
VRKEIRNRNDWRETMFEKEREEQDLKVQQLTAHQEAEILSVKQQVDINKVEITYAVVAVRGDVDAIQERLSKVEGTSHELVHLESSVQQIQQKLEDNASEASRQLREQGRQLEQEITKLKQRVGQQVPLPPHRFDSATDKGAAVASMSRPEFSTDQE